MQFLHLLLIGSAKESINQFYFDNIHHLLSQNDKTQEILNNIMSSSELLASRYFITKCDESLRLLFTVLEKALIEIINPTSNLQMNSYEKINEITFKENLQRISNIENDLWLGFVNFQMINDQNFSLKSSPKGNKFYISNEEDEDTLMAHYYINYNCNQIQDKPQSINQTISITQVTPQKNKNTKIYDQQS